VQEEALQFTVGMMALHLRIISKIGKSFDALDEINRLSRPGLLGFSCCTHVALCLGKTLDFSKSVVSKIVQEGPENSGFLGVSGIMVKIG
jgi:hypothetical protein